MDSAKLNWDKYDDNSLRSCVSDVDLEYLKALHKLLNDYPLAPEKLEKQNKNEGNVVWLTIKNWLWLWYLYWKFSS